jgi:vancomycin resistance protein YoaR
MTRVNRRAPRAVLAAWLAAQVALAALPPPAAAADDADTPILLGTFATTLIGSLPARTDNIRLAAEALDGTVLEPGEVLSFNRTVGPRTAERGYQAAPVILREAREIQVGGGVCQVASTLFDAALLAGLEAAERHRHSYSVDYVPPGQDATIAWGAKDLKIRNVLEQRVRIRVEVVGATLIARVLGQLPPQAEYELSAVSRDLPSVAEGGGAGLEVELYRVERTGGHETGRVLLHRDVYPPSLPRRARGEE